MMDYVLLCQKTILEGDDMKLSWLFIGMLCATMLLAACNGGNNTGKAALPAKLNQNGQGGGGGGGTRFCADSDSGSFPLVAGNVTYYNQTRHAYDNFKDTCLSGIWNNYLQEYYCEGYEARWYQVPCPNNYGSDYYCEVDQNGRGYCKQNTTIPPPANSCNDSDNGVYPLLFGHVTGFANQGVPYNYADDCTIVDGVEYQKEWHCNGLVPTSGLFNCQTYGNFACINGVCVLQQTPQEDRCDDNDGGNYPLVAGNATYWNATDGYRYVRDQCMNQQELFEWFCADDNKLDGEYKTCRDYGVYSICWNDEHGNGFCTDPNPIP
jgi:hypothetical protein